MKITVKESTIIRPAQDTPTKRLWVSNLDLLVSMVHIPTVYFFKPNGSGDFFDFQKLKEALSKVLVMFYPMAGRLDKDENGRIEINCNGEGVVVIEAETTSVIDDFGDFTPSPEMLELVPMVDYSGDILSFPLFLAQVTHFKCGGVCLGVRLHHTIADGYSALHFINSWADMTRGIPINIPPFIDRTLLKGRVPPTPTFPHIEYDPPFSMIASNETSEVESCPKPTTTKIFTITLDQINALKSKIQKEGNCSSKCSTYEAVAAHIWRCACEARDLSHNQPTKLYIPTDGRSRLNPPLPRGYFGNAVFASTIWGPSGEIKSEPLASTVERIHQRSMRMDDQYLRSALDFLQEQHDLTTLRREHHIYKCPNLKVNSWIRLPTHDADFGWGRSIFMGPANIAFEGNTYIMRSPSYDGTLLVVIGLETTQMEIFQKILYDF